MPSLFVVMIFMPAAAAALLLLLDAKAPPVRARWTALMATLATCLVSVVVASYMTVSDGALRIRTR